jgi:AraC-like DNA-binding protein
MMTLDLLLDGLDVTMGRFALPVVHSRSVAYGKTDEPTIYYGLGGAARLEIEEDATVSPRTVIVVTVSARTVVVVPPHWRTRVVLQSGRRQGDDVVACLPIHATYQGSVGLFHHLRQPLVERFRADDAIRDCFEELLNELHAPRPGSRAMSDALLRQGLIRLLRRFFERGDFGLRWLAPLADAAVGRTVSAMHQQPQHCFSLAELADLAGMSRSVFAVRFAHAIGQSPIEFLKTLRLARAAALLTRTDLPVKGVAARVGYASRSSFTRAFATSHGRAPAAFRAAARRSEPNVSCGVPWTPTDMEVDME